MSQQSEKLKNEEKKAMQAIRDVNCEISRMGMRGDILHKQLTAVQNRFDQIRNIPSETRNKYEQTKQICANWEDQSKKIEREYNAKIKKAAGGGAAGAGLGIGIVAFGPTTAMGIATTFGVASTGTAISTLSGAAATNAALAWLGGGSLAVGGGGMVAGQAFLALAGPVGWSIAAISLVSSMILFFKAKSDRSRLENIFILINERDTKKYELAIAELKERSKRIKNYSSFWTQAINEIEGYGIDYNAMSQSQKFNLGAYANRLMESTQLLVNPITGLMPQYTVEKLTEYRNAKPDTFSSVICGNTTTFYLHEECVVALMNLLHNIQTDETDRKLLAKTLKQSKEFLSAMRISSDYPDLRQLLEIANVLDERYNTYEMLQSLQSIKQSTQEMQACYEAWNEMLQSMIQSTQEITQALNKMRTPLSELAKNSIHLQ